VSQGSFGEIGIMEFALYAAGFLENILIVGNTCLIRASAIYDIRRKDVGQSTRGRRWIQLVDYLID